MTRGVLPLIGITADVSNATAADVNGVEPAAWVLPQRYVAAITRAGAIPVAVSGPQVRSALPHLLSRLNGLVLSGGNFDIHPRHYGEKPIKQLREVKAERTDFELAIAAAALKCNLPILGICGGAQAINVALGGSLYQDIASQIPGAIVHERGSRHAVIEHPVRVENGTKLSRILGDQHVTVNSTHHQSVKQPGRGLIVSAVARDGVIEGIESTEHDFVIGVQWHPEVLATRRQIHRRLFACLVGHCKRRFDRR